MNLRLLAITSVLSAVTLSVSAETWDINGTACEVTTHRTADLFPGCTIHTIEVGSDSQQRRIWYWEVDLQAENVDIITYNPENIRTTGTTVPDMATKLNDKGHDVRVGANADLYSTYGPIGTTVMDGEIIKIAKPSTAWHAVGFDDETRQMYMGTVNIIFAAKLNGVTEYAPTLVNVPMANNETIIYTRRWGKSTGTTKGSSGLEILLRPEGGILRSDGVTTCTVVEAPVKDGGDMEIPEGCIVLSTTIPSHINDLGLMKAGDTYTLNPASFSISPAAMSSYSFRKCTRLIGGDPMLLVDGQKLNSYATMPNYDTRRDRTAIGTDRSRSKMYVLIVEKSSASVGANAQELASIMKAIGCHEALNFDGGGSTTMWTAGDGVLNSCSDGHPRAVRNGIFVAYQPSDGVDSIENDGEFDENAPSEYFSLGGFPVENLAPGIYIRRQGHLSKLVIIK